MKNKLIISKEKAKELGLELINAVSSNDFEKTNSLLERGADVNVINANGVSPLSVACFRENIEIGQLLINYGANVNEETNNCSLMQIGCWNNNFKVVEMLINNKAIINSSDNNLYATPLYNACFKKNFDIAEFLIKNGADIYLKNNGGDSLLHIACLNQEFEIVKFLVNQKIDVNLTNDNGVMPLHIACGAGNVQIVDFLLQNGADKEAKDNCNSKLLNHAIPGSNLEMVKFLVEKVGCDINYRVNEQYVLNNVCWSGKFDIAEFLLSKGALYDANNGVDTLHNFCLDKKFEALEFLFEHGIHIDAKNASNETPLYIACIYNQQDVVKFLLSHGANINALNVHNNHTAMQIATLNGFEEIVSMLKDAPSALLLTKTTSEILRKSFTDNCIKIEEDGTATILDEKIQMILLRAEEIIHNSTNLKDLQKSCLNLQKNLLLLADDDIHEFSSLGKFSEVPFLLLNTLNKLTEKEIEFAKFLFNTKFELSKFKLVEDLFNNKEIKENINEITPEEFLINKNNDKDDEVNLGGEDN